jgi:ABC-type dipeptide/oligopeptide/nickel transport system ATPase component
MLLGIEGQPPRPGRRPAGCHFAPRCDLAGPECSEAEPPPEGWPGGASAVSRPVSHALPWSGCHEPSRRAREAR